MINVTTKIGVISDTHGHLPKGLADAFRGVKRIVHAGDIDHPRVLDQLRKIAPVTAVRGNMDGGAWAERLPSGDYFQVNGLALYVQHILERLDIDPQAASVSAVISGHTHEPLNDIRAGVLYFNPGSACFPRHGNPPSVGILEIGGGKIQGRIIHL
jgi:putative phosphoesterase